MNFVPLFTTTRVVGSVYKLVSSSILLLCIAKRLSSGRPLTGRRWRDKSSRFFERD